MLPITIDPISAFTAGVLITAFLCICYLIHVERQHQRAIIHVRETTRRQAYAQGYQDRDTKKLRNACRTGKTHLAQFSDESLGKPWPQDPAT